MGMNSRVLDQEEQNIRLDNQGFINMGMSPFYIFNDFARALAKRAVRIWKKQSPHSVM